MNIYKKWLSLGLIGCLSFSSVSFVSAGENVIEGKKHFIISSLAYSPDSQSFAYIASKNWKQFIVKNWIEEKQYDYIRSSMFSPDWKSFVYVWSKDWKNLIIKDGVELWEWYNPVFSPDWKSFAYIATKNWKQVIMKDGIEGNWYYFIDRPVFSLDSQGFAYIVIDNKEWKFSVVKDWVMGVKYDLIYTLKFSPDWKSLVYGAKKDWKYLIVKDGVELWEWDTPVFSPDSKSFIYVIDKNWKSLIIKNWVELWEWYYPVFSPDSKSLAYLVEKDGKKIVVKNWVELWEWYYPVFSPDSKSFTYIEYSKSDKRNYIIKDWIKWKEYFDKITSLTYSPDSKSLVYLVEKDGKKIVVKNWVEITKYKPSTIDWFTFSPDSKTFAFIASDENWKQFVVQMMSDDVNTTTSTTNNQVTNTTKTNTDNLDKNRPYKLLTNKQRKSLLKQIDNFSMERMNKIVSKIDKLLSGSKLSQKNRNLLEDVKRLLEDKWAKSSVDETATKVADDVKNETTTTSFKKLTQDQIAAIKKTAYIEGSKDALITLVEYADLECPFSIRQYKDGVIKKIREKYGDKVNFIFKNFRAAFHENSEAEANASLCAGNLGGAEKYATYYSTIFERTKGGNGIGFPKNNLVPLAKELGLDEQKIQACIDSRTNIAQFDADTEEGKKLWVNGTPGTVIINNKTGEYEIIAGAYPLDEFEKTIDSLLGLK